MGEAVLMDLEEIIRTKPKNMEMTDRELQLIQSWKNRAMYSFIGVSLASSTAVWFATKGMSPGYRFPLSFGSAIVSGIWNLRRSLEKLSEISISQTNMDQFVLERNYLNESTMNIFKKYFYPEEVYYDSNPDKSYIRWRRRNIYQEGASIHDNIDIKDATVSEKPNKPNSPQMRQSTSQPVVGEMLADPLDCMFGQGDATEAARFESGVSTKKQLRARKRAHRRHQIHHGEQRNSDDDLKIRI